jgi:hypothetical protein
MLRTVIFKCFKYLCVEAVGALNRFGLLRLLRFVISTCHAAIVTFFPPSRECRRVDKVVYTIDFDNT